MKWQVIAPRSLRICPWDNEVVVYDTTSGNTHLLDATTAQVLAAVTEAPADAATITQILADLGFEGSGEQAFAQVDAILAELADISLITPATP